MPFLAGVGNNRHHGIFSGATCQICALNNLPPLKIWDISPPVDEHAAVFPGDTAYSQAVHFSLTPNCSVNIHSITLSPHTWTHAVQNLPPRVLVHHHCTARLSTIYEIAK